jgi:hypothetical protein
MVAGGKDADGLHGAVQQLAPAHGPLLEGPPPLCSLRRCPPRAEHLIRMPLGGLGLDLMRPGSHLGEEGWGPSDPR